MSNTRNGLLAQIVQAAGGTVTDASNRNLLLQDWLSAVSAPSTRYYADLNGVDQYVLFDSPVIYSGDFSISCYTKMPDVPPPWNQALYGGAGGGSPNSGAFTLFINPSQSLLSLQLPTSSGTRYDISTPLPELLGRIIKIALSRTAGVLTLEIDDQVVDTFDSNPFGVVDVSVANIGRWSTQLYFSGRVYNYTDSLGNNYPIDDNSLTTVRNTGTGPDATPINFTTSTWAEGPI